ncbi:MAG: sigW13 [Candidatus Doudnabacteria bacterium]|nr:sigW13 [Candidatus Doudnabacteria bacterium]
MKINQSNLISENTADPQLILEAQKENQLALELLVKRYIADSYRLSLQYLKTQIDAEDAVQEVFVKVWRNIKKVDPDKNFKAWLLEVTKNTCLDILKKKKALPFSAFELADGSNPLVDNLISPLASPLELAETASLQGLINKAKSSLPNKYKNILALYYEQGLNLREISEALKVPIDTIKSQHRRALISLKKLIR